ncbi:hypothetical protein OA57_12065 [Chelonobacter oris]|uniref:Xylose isomerase-like TIM barrel domain-containing protein n=1 Tax=Chelonobacter oris TaxID=505317 RepID=A0A0A3B6W7_9PAST|nr:hypothetical protein [Chelonobacter oris]KGQ69344.1 hypothetical protein OA57_12065 [Chelonobacter oris]
MSRKIIIVASAYGEDYLRQNGGQNRLPNIVKAAGADGIEIRRELFSEHELPRLPRLAQAIAQRQLDCFYSVPYPLFTSLGEINSKIRQFFDEATLLNARLLKFSLGFFQPSMPDHPAIALCNIINSYPNIQCAIENDQQHSSGNLSVMTAFADWIQSHRLPLQLAFDSGNWRWVNQDPLIAAQKLSPYVGYIHTKSTALDTEGNRIAVPPTTKDPCLAYLPSDVAIGIEFPLRGTDKIAVSRYFVELLRG